MAKITINADTSSKDLEVLVDGKTIDNVNAASFYLCPCYNDPTEMELNVCINTYVHDKESGLKTSVNLTASDTGEGQRLLKDGARLDKNLKDFVVTKSSNKLTLDLADFFNRRF
jgi:hypothetical protein